MSTNTDALRRGAPLQPLEAQPVELAVPSVAEVYEAHFAYVHRCLRGLGVHPSALDDALQDVFVVVQNKLPQFEPRARLRTWLYAIVLRVARRYRARWARHGAELLPNPPGSEPSCERDVQAHERLRLAQLALSGLGEEKREVFVFAQIEAMSAPEIAEITGLPVNTVYSRLRAARAAFAANVERAQRGLPIRREP